MLLKNKSNGQTQDAVSPSEIWSALHYRDYNNKDAVKRVGEIQYCKK